MDVNYSKIHEKAVESGFQSEKFKYPRGEPKVARWQHSSLPNLSEFHSVAGNAIPLECHDNSKWFWKLRMTSDWHSKNTVNSQRQSKYYKKTQTSRDVYASEFRVSCNFQRNLKCL